MTKYETLKLTRLSLLNSGQCLLSQLIIDSILSHKHERMFKSKTLGQSRANSIMSTKGRYIEDPGYLGSTKDGS